MAGIASNLHLRAFEPGDLAAIAPLVSSTRERLLTAEELAVERAAATRATLIEMVAVVGGDVVGWAKATNHYVDGSGIAFIGVSTSPAQRRRGIGSALFDAIARDLSERGISSGAASIDASRMEGLEFAARRGFVEQSRLYRSTLDLEAFDPTPYLATRQSLQANGIRFETAAELGDTAAVRRQIFELETVTDHDIPGFADEDRRGWDDYAAQEFVPGRYRPDLEVLAFHRGRAIGVSGLQLTPSGAAVSQHAGVLREYRRQGLATVLKAEALRRAKLAGIGLAETYNHSGNVAMLAINERLGYARKSTWVHVKGPLPGGIS